MKKIGEKESDAEEERWYRELEGTSLYKKLKSLGTCCDERIKVCKKSKRWWDKELSERLKKTRKTRKEKEEEGINQKGRVRR